MCRCSFCLPRRGSYGASDWIHWTGHHGTPHGEESPEGGIPPRRPQPKPRTRGRARPGGRESRHLAARRRSAVRGGDHHAAQLARRRARRAREGWHHRGGAAWADLRGDRKSTRLNSSHLVISYAVFCLKKKTIESIYLTVPGAAG